MNEYKRVFVNRYWIALMLLFIVVSSGLYIDARSHDGTFSGAKSLAHSYVENLKTYDKMDVPSAIEALEGKQAELSAYSAVSNWYGQKDSNPEYYNMVKEAYLEKYPEIVAMAEAGTLIFDAEEAKIELLVAPQLIAQYKHIESYPGELEEIHNRSKQLLQFSIFNQEDSYSQRNILKTSKDFSSIEGSNITNGKDISITSIFDGNFLNYAVFAAAFLVIYLLIQERQRGLWTLVYATPVGRRKLAQVRIKILFLASIQSIFSLYFCRILLSIYLYGGFGNVSRPIQSILQYKQITYPLSILQYLSVYFVLLIFAVFMLSLVLYLFISSIHHLNLGIAVTAVFVVSQYVLFSTIRDSALLLPLRYINVFSYVYLLPMLTQYLNMNFFGFPVSARIVALAVLPLIVLTSTLWILYYTARQYPVSSSNKWEKLLSKIKMKLDRLTATRSAFRYELYKIFIIQKGILILVAFIIFEFTYIGIPSLPPAYGFGSSTARNPYQSEVTVDLIQELSDEEELLQKEMDLMIENEENTMHNMVFESLSSSLDQARRLRMDAEDLYTYSLESGQKTYFFDDSLYLAYTNGEDHVYRNKTALRLLLFIVLIHASTFSIESNSKMRKLNRSTRFGRSRLWRHKCIIAFSTSTVIALTSYALELFRSIEIYGKPTHLYAPIQQLMQFRMFPIELSIGQYFLLLFLARLISLYALTALVLFISSIAPTNEFSLILNTGLFLVPAFIAYIGITAAKHFSFTTPLSLVELTRGNSLSILILLGTAILALVLSHRKMNKT